MRKLYLTDVPKKIYRGRICRDYDEVVGKIPLPFMYDDLKGFINLIAKIDKNTYEAEYNGTRKFLTTNDLRASNIGTLIGKRTYEFRYSIGDKVIDKFKNVTITELIKKSNDNSCKKRYIKYFCNNCHTESGYVLEQSFLKEKYKCSNCVKIINTDPDIIKFLPNGIDDARKYNRMSGKKIYPICPDCNKQKDKAMQISDIVKWKSIGCKCGDGKSRPEKMFAEVLNQLNVDYEWGYQAEWLKGYDGSIRSAEIDFILPNKMLAFEIDGLLGHENPNPYIHNDELQEEFIKKSKDKDIWKEEQAIKQGIHTIRVKANESSINYLKEQISISLAGIFDLSTIDWNKCDEFATSNLVRMVCDYYNQNYYISPTKISKHYHLGRNTVTRYLNQGNKLGWCKYGADEKYYIRSIETKYNGAKQINVINNKTNEIIKTYKSVIDLCRMSINDFGIKFCKDSVYRVARGERKEHYGYSFTYAC